MLGQGLLRECLAAPDVSRVTTIGRAPSGAPAHPKLNEVTAPDLAALSDEQLRGPFDACFFVIGVTSSGLDEAAYTRLTFDLTLAVARPLLRLNPGMTFIYGSGAGADSSGTSRTMWARVRGRTENALFKLPFKTVCAIRPGLIQPLHGAQSKTTSYRVFYRLLSPLLPIARWLAPRTVLSTEIIGRAMLNIARRGADKKVLEAGDIWQAAQISQGPVRSTSDCRPDR